MATEEDEAEIEEIIEHPIGDELDLHTFRPNEIGSLIPEYLRECRIRGLTTVRIVHGKGTGPLREGVHRLLERLPEVVGFRSGDETSGSWGATLVTLVPWKGGNAGSGEMEKRSSDSSSRSVSL